MSQAPDVYVALVVECRFGYKDQDADLVISDETCYHVDCIDLNIPRARESENNWIRFVLSLAFPDTLFGTQRREPLV